MAEESSPQPQPQPSGDAADAPTQADQRPSSAPESASQKAPNEKAARPRKKSRKGEPREALVVERRSGFFMRWLKRLVAILVLLLLIFALAFVGLTLLLRSSIPRTVAESVATGALQLDVRLGGVEVGWAGDITIRDLELRLPHQAEETELSLAADSQGSNHPAGASTQPSSTRPLQPTQASIEEDRGPLLLQVPLIHAELPALPLVAMRLAVGQQPEVKALTIEDPTVYVTEEAQGQWNVVRAFTLVSTGRRDDPDSPPGPPDLPPLPGLSLTGGTLVLADAEGNRKEITGIRAQGERRGPLVYAFNATVPETAGVAGRLLPSSGLRQEITLRVENLAEQVAPVFSIPDVAAHVQWKGGFTRDGGISGLVTVDEGTRFETTTFDGSVQVDQGEEGLTLKPRLIARNVPGGVGQAELVEGTIRLADEIASAEEMLFTVYDGQFKVDLAAFNLDSRTGHFDTIFTDLQPQEDVRVGGTITGALDYGTFGRPLASITTDIYGQWGDRRIQQLTTLVEAVGVGDRGLMGLLASDVRLTAQQPPLILGATRESIILPRTTAQVLVRLAGEQRRWIELAEVRSLDPDVVELAGAGIYFLDSTAPAADASGDASGNGGDPQAGDYWLWLEQKGWPLTLPRMDESLPLELGVELRGRLSGPVLEPVRVVELYGNLADIQLDGAGWYVPNPETATSEMFDELATVGTPQWAPERPRLGPTSAPPENAFAGMEDAGEASEDLIQRWGEVVAARPEGWAGDPQESSLPDKPPLRLRLTLARTPQSLAPQTPGAAELATAAESQREEAARIPIEGAIRSWFDIGGSFGRDIIIEGYGGLVTSGFAVGNYELGDTNTRVAARVARSTQKEAGSGRSRDRGGQDYHLLVTTPEPTKLLGADIEFAADMPFDEAQPSTLEVQVAGLELERLSAAAGAGTPISGELAGGLSVALQGFAPDTITAAGEFSIQDLATPVAQLAGEMTLSPSFENNRLTLPVRLRQDVETVPGPVVVTEPRTIETQLIYDLALPKRLVVRGTQAVAYPISISLAEAGMAPFVETRLGLDARELTIALTDEGPRLEGTLEASADVLTGERMFDLRELADGDLRFSGNGSLVGIEQLHVDLPGLGRIVGGGDISLQDLAVESKVWLHGERLDLEAIASRLNLPEGAEGILDFSLTSEKTIDPRSPGELMVNFAFAGEEARWRSIDIDQGQVMAYLARDPLRDGTARGGAFAFTLLSTERLSLHVGGGRIGGFFKLRYHGERPNGLIDAWQKVAQLDDDERLFVQFTSSLDDLRLEQFATFLGRDAGGSVDARIRAFGDLNQRVGRAERRRGEGQTAQSRLVNGINGDLELAVNDGDLGNFNIFQRLLEFAQVVPGSASDTLILRARLEGGHAYYEQAEAFVDGVQINSTGTLRELLTTDETLINGSAIVFFRPLSQIPLPFFEEADEILAAIQGNLTSVSLSGRLRDPRVVPQSFEAAGEALRTLLVGSARRKSR